MSLSRANVNLRLNLSFLGTFDRIRKLLKFCSANVLTESLGNFVIKIEWKGSFQEDIFEN